MTTTPKKMSLYEAGKPRPDANARVAEWLSGSVSLREHAPVKAFSGARVLLDAALNTALSNGEDLRSAARKTLSGLTTFMFAQSLDDALGYLSVETINAGGFRTARSQGFAKNWGENFVNSIVYVLARAYEHHPLVVVAKGTPPLLRNRLESTRLVPLHGSKEKIKIGIECDLCVYRRDDPERCVVVNAKTRLKEVFHIGTMWALLFDIMTDPELRKRFGIVADKPLDRRKARYVFATADSVNTDGAKTQGGDVERDEPRNLIKMDALFFDYVFVSKEGIGHVAKKLDASGTREAVFHELGCLVDLIDQIVASSEESPLSGRERDDLPIVPGA